MAEKQNPAKERRQFGVRRKDASHKENAFL
jgi:hypothetical protein